MGRNYWSLAPRKDLEDTMRNNGALPAPLRPLSLQQVTVGGEIGRRIELAIYKNFMVLDIERDFLAPFRQRMARPML